jgi:drug/metabolite transporter (DMT)-like permease
VSSLPSTSWAAEARTRARQSLLVPHLALLVTIVVWSANATVLKIGLAHVRPIPFVAARFVIGAAFLALLAIATRRELRRVPPLRLLVPAALSGIIGNQLGFTFGVQLSTAVDASIIMGASPIFAAIVLFLVSGRQPPPRRLLGLGIGFLGLLLVVAAGARGGGGSLAGNAIAVLAPTSWGAYLVVAARANRTTNALVFLTWTTLFAVVLLVPMAVVETSLTGSNDWLPAIPAILYSGLVATGLAYALYFWALPRVGVTETAVYTYLQPLLGALMAAFFLHEAFGPLQVVGAVAILLAAYLGSWSRVRVPQQPAA